jgi:hypothetical protein
LLVVTERRNYRVADKRKGDKMEKLTNLMEYIVMLFIMLIVFLLCLIPTWIFLVLKYMIGPMGFWQKFAVYGLGIYFLGGLQIVGIILFLVFIFYFLEKISK